MFLSHFVFSQNLKMSQKNMARKSPNVLKEARNQTSHLGPATNIRMSFSILKNSGMLKKKKISEWVSVSIKQEVANLEKSISLIPSS